MNFYKTSIFIALLGTITFSNTIFAQSKEELEEMARLKKDISFLASDALGGRQTGSPGELASANYIRESFKKSGLTLLGKEGFQEFSITQFRMASDNCKFGIVPMGGEAMNYFVIHQDYYPLSLSSNNDSISAETVDVGYGIVSEKLNKNDYNGLDVKGKVAIIRLGFFGQKDNPHSELAEYSDITTKIKEAEKQGVVGIIFIRSSMTEDVPSGQLSRTAVPTHLPIFFFKSRSSFPNGIKVIMKSLLFAPTAFGHNVIAFKNNHKKKTVIICAHHDHIGLNEYENSRYKGPSAIHNGADDNASGVAAMLELARKVKGWKYRKNNYLFIAFSGEELGLLGSKFFVQNPEINLKQINFVINIDMLGRIDSSKKILTINGIGTSPNWKTSLSKVKSDTHKIQITTTESGMGPSDHASFYLENIPVLHFFSGQHRDYHTPTDDEELINYFGMAQSIDIIKQMIKLSSSRKKIEFSKTKDATPGRTKFKVSMGVMPDYSFSGKGMRIDGVSENKPAIKAGLLRNDIIIQLGDYSVTGVEDYMSALSKFNAGDKTTVKVLRGSETMSFNIEFK